MQEADVGKSVICPGCNCEIVPIVDYEYGLAPKIMACLLCPLCSCCLPFLIPEFKTPHYYCPNCNSQITEFDPKFGRKQSTEKMSKSKSPKTITFEILNINVLQKLPERVHTQDDIKLRKTSSEEYIENKQKSFRGSRNEKNFSDTCLKLESGHQKDLDSVLLSKNQDVYSGKDLYQRQFDENFPQCYCHVSPFHENTNCCKCNRPKPCGDLNKNGDRLEMNTCCCVRKNGNQTIFCKCKNNSSETNANVIPQTLAKFEFITNPKRRSRSKSKTRDKPKTKSTIELNVVPCPNQESYTKKVGNFEICVKSGTSISTSSPSVSSMSSHKRKKCPCPKKDSAVVEKCKKCIKTASRCTTSIKKTVYSNKSSLTRRAHKEGSNSSSARPSKNSELTCKCKDKQTSYHEASPDEDKIGLFTAKTTSSVTATNTVELGHVENASLRSKIPVDITRRNQAAILNDLLKLLEQTTTNQRPPSTQNINIAPVISVNPRKTSSESVLSDVVVQTECSSVEKPILNKCGPESNIHRTKTTHNRWGLKTHHCSSKTSKDHVLCQHKSRKLLHHSKKSKKMEKSKESLPNSCECKKTSKDIETIFSRTSVCTSENKQKPKSRGGVSRKNSKSKHHQPKSICACKTESKVSKKWSKSKHDKRSKTICACKAESNSTQISVCSCKKRNSKARNKKSSSNVKCVCSSQSLVTKPQKYCTNSDRKHGNGKQDSVTSVCSSRSEQTVVCKSKGRNKHKSPCACKSKEKERPSKVSINVSVSTESIMHGTESSVTNTTTTTVVEEVHKRPRTDYRGERPSEVSFSDSTLGKNQQCKCKTKEKGAKRKKSKTRSDTMITEECRCMNPKKKSKTNVVECSSENISIVVEKCEPKRKKNRGEEEDPCLLHTEISQVSFCSEDSGQVHSSKSKRFKKKKEKTPCKCPSGSSVGKKQKIKSTKRKTVEMTVCEPEPKHEKDPIPPMSITIINEIPAPSTTSLCNTQTPKPCKPCEKQSSHKKKIFKRKPKKPKDQEEHHSCMIKSIKKCTPVADFRTSMSNDSQHNSCTCGKQPRSGIPTSVCLRTSPVGTPVGSSEMRSKIPRCSLLCSHCEQQYLASQSGLLQDSQHKKAHKKRFGRSKSKKRSKTGVVPCETSPERDLCSVCHQELVHCCCPRKTLVSRCHSDKSEHSHRSEKPSCSRCRQSITRCKCPKKTLKCGTDGHSCPNRSRSRHKHKLLHHSKCKRESTSCSSTSITSATSTSESCPTCKKLQTYPCVEKENPCEMCPQRNARSNTPKMYFFVEETENFPKSSKKRSTCDMTPRKSLEEARTMCSCKMATQKSSVDYTSSQITFTEEETDVSKLTHSRESPRTTSSLSQSSQPSNPRICDCGKHSPTRNNCRYCTRDHLFAQARKLFAKPERKCCYRNFSPVHSEPTSACRICRKFSPTNSSEMLISEMSLDSPCVTPTLSNAGEKTMRSKIPRLVCRTTSPISCKTDEKRPLSRKESRSNNLKKHTNSSSSCVSFERTPRNNFKLNRHEPKSNLRRVQANSSVVSCEMCRSDFGLNQNTFQTADVKIYNCACHNRYPQQHVFPKDSLEHIRRMHNTTRCQICGQKSTHCCCYGKPERYEMGRRNKRTNTICECKQLAHHTCKDELCPKSHGTTFTGNQTNNPEMVNNPGIHEQGVYCCRPLSPEKRKKKQKFICERCAMRASPSPSQTSQLSVSSTSKNVETLKCQNCHEIICCCCHRPKRTRNHVRLGRSRSHHKSKEKKSLSFKQQESSLLICTVSTEKHAKKAKKRKKSHRTSSKKASKHCFCSSQSSSHSDFATAETPLLPEQFICVATKAKKPKNVRKRKKGSKVSLSSTESTESTHAPTHVDSLTDVHKNSSVTTHVVGQHQMPECLVCSPYNKGKKKKKKFKKGTHVILTPVCIQDYSGAEMPFHDFNDDVEHPPTLVEPKKKSFFKRLLGKKKSGTKRQYFICKINDEIHAKNESSGESIHDHGNTHGNTPAPVYEQELLVCCNHKEKVTERKIHECCHVDTCESLNSHHHEKKKKRARKHKHSSCHCFDNPHDSEHHHRKKKKKSKHKAKNCCCFDPYESEHFHEHPPIPSHYLRHSSHSEHSFTPCQCSRTHRPKTYGCPCLGTKKCTCPSKRKSRSSNERVICCRKCSCSHSKKHKKKKKKKKKHSRES